MSSKKNSYNYTLQLIADILSFESSTEALQQQMASNSIDWEKFVYVASDYLVLTTCFCRLKQKHLLEELPQDLKLYLEEITNINRNRNKTLLEEIRTISNLLTSNHINHVFLKGSAFLVKDYYEDLGERMLGDIDILVEEHQAQTTYQLLINNNYTGTSQGISAKYFENKHLPRLQSKVNLAAVEVHTKVSLKYHKGQLDSQRILHAKKLVGNINVPSDKHLLFHTILNFQANDSGYIYSRISFKSIYDLLILNRKNNFTYDDTFEPAYYKNYFSIAKLFFKDLNSFKSNPFINKLFLLKLEHSHLRKFIDYITSKIIYLKVILTSRIGVFIKNKNYRRDLLKKYKRVIGM